MQLPVKPEKKERRKEERTILLFEYQDTYAIRKRQNKGLLAGLWELPGVEEKLTKEELLLRLNEYGISNAKVESLGKAKHIFSHVEWHMSGYHIVLPEASSLLLLEEGAYTNLRRALWANVVWANREEMKHKYSIPNAFQAYTNKI